MEICWNAIFDNLLQCWKENSFGPALAASVTKGTAQ
jgi:hypothetical protein